MPVDFLSTDLTEIERQLRDAFRSATDANGDSLFGTDDPGSPGYNLRRLFARLLRSERQNLNSLLSEMSPRTASGPALDEWARLFSMTRTRAEKGQGRALIMSEVTGQALENLYGTRLIEQGTLLRTASGASYRTTSEATFEDGSRSVEISIEPAYNSTAPIDAGASLELVGSDPIFSALEGEVLQSVTNGTPRETDEQLRYRLLRALRAPYTLEGLEAEMLGHSDVSSVQIEERTYGAGTAEAFVIPSTPLPTPTLRQELEAMYQAPGRLYVTFPDYEAVAMRILVRETVSLSGVVDYVNNLEPGRELILNALESLLQQAGSGDAQVLEMTRGRVDTDGAFVGGQRIAPVNLTPSDGRSKWYVRPDWITLCTSP